jgi:GntR family transcriptional regulator/MocR family aminotransferase
MKNKYSIDWLIPGLNKTKCTSQIIDFIIQAVTSGDLMAGDFIPSYRALAKLNKVGESSVRRAYTKLVDTYWLTSNPGSATSISKHNPTENLVHEESGFTERFSAGMPIKNKNAVTKKIAEPFSGVGSDFPSPASFPDEKLLSYYVPLLLESKGLTQAEFFAAFDSNELRAAVIENLNRKRGFGLNQDMLTVIHGRKSSLDRVFKCLITPGDVVVNTAPFDLKLAIALEKCGAKVQIIDRKHDDFLERLEQLCENTKVRAIHIRPQCSYPESYSLSEAACNRLIELAKKYKICLIEEEDDHEFWYGQNPFRALASRRHGGFVIYMGALSKASPETSALRLVVASTQFIADMQLLPKQSIEHRDVIRERAIARMIANGDMLEYARDIRLKSRVYRDQLHKILKDHLRKYIEYDIPQNGLTFWLKFDEVIDLNMVLNKLEEMGIPVPYHPNHQKTKEKLNYMMLGFGAFDINEALGAAKLLGQIISGLHPK